MNGLSNLDETYREYSLAPTDDLIGLWRSQVKVIAVRRGVEGIHFDVKVHIMVRRPNKVGLKCPSIRTSTESFNT